MRSIFGSAVLLLLCLFATACSSDGDSVLTIDASGALAGLLFVDANGDGVVTAGSDVVAPDLSFALVRGGSDTVATGTTDETGVAVLTTVPVGTYRVVVDPTQLGDTLRVDEAAASVTVEANTTTSAVVPLQHPARPIRVVREAEPGRLLAVEGVALNAWAAFGDSTVHVADSSGAVRAVRVRGSAAVAGDSVRVLGRTALSSGDPALSGAIVLVLGPGTEPEPPLLTTAEAGTARHGDLAAALVRVEGARVIESGELASGDLLLRVNDGSGILDLLIDRHAPIDVEDPLLPGVLLDVTGVLVPMTGDRWQLKPRLTTDVEVLTPTVTIATARATPAGQVVSIEGVATSGYSTFGNGSVHVTDPTGSIRVIFRTRSFIVAGDSVSVVGTIENVDGQPRVANFRSDNHGSAEGEVEPIVLSTGEAAEARGGEVDAALVQVMNATVTITGSVTSETHLLVNDGSGALTVVLDRDAEISDFSYEVGDVLDVVGVLVPATDTWFLKPRSDSDIRRPE